MILKWHEYVVFDRGNQYRQSVIVLGAELCLSQLTCSTPNLLMMTLNLLVLISCYQYSKQIKRYDCTHFSRPANYRTDSQEHLNAFNRSWFRCVFGTAFNDWRSATIKVRVSIVANFVCSENKGKKSKTWNFCKKWYKNSTKLSSRGEKYEIISGLSCLRLEWNLPSSCILSSRLWDLLKDKAIIQSFFFCNFSWSCLCIQTYISVCSGKYTTTNTPCIICYNACFSSFRWRQVT